ncbi:hypothetical protein [Pseudomonas duriflava]|uniref:hypothetical protein n=1 Tax=Pseudomonas duriflava TaxID=459528 RepID=UPI001315578A|nr:hypothetical protein [Pseudomonas duriflava]
MAAVIDQAEYLHPSICHEDISVSEYFEWEEAVVEKVAAVLDITYSDASAIVGAQLFIMQQAWSMGMEIDQVSKSTIGAA